ncbi:unnamed protein product [Closterium sp. NIES-54]
MAAPMSRQMARQQIHRQQMPPTIGGGSSGRSGGGGYSGGPGVSCVLGAVRSGAARSAAGRLWPHDLPSLCPESPFDSGFLREEMHQLPGMPLPGRVEGPREHAQKLCSSSSHRRC